MLFAAEAAEVQANWNVCLVVNVAIAVFVIALLIWGMKRPVVWRLLSVLGMAAGSGFLVQGILGMATDQQLAHVAPPALIGIGTGILVGSITLLVISFLGCGSRKE